MNSTFTASLDRGAGSLPRRTFLTTLGAAALLAAVLPSAFAAPKPKRLVFVLAGQSNMEGQAVVDLAGSDYNQGRGTLLQVLQHPAQAARFPQLRDAAGQWHTRPEVAVSYQPENGPLRAGPLGFGFTPYGDKHHFGPELQFGHLVADGLHQPILLVKTAWGGKSLYEDFRPPSAGGKPGPYYHKMISQIRAALAADSEWDNQVAGFVWYQGWNDGCDPQHAVPEYEANLVHLIHDVRRDLGAPKLPFVIGELTGPWVNAPAEWQALRHAQAAPAARPEFRDSVRFVPTHDFVRRPEDSPNPGHGHHEFGNAETYLLVGEAFGKAMLELVPPH